MIDNEFSLALDELFKNPKQRKYLLNYFFACEQFSVANREKDDEKMDKYSLLRLKKLDEMERQVFPTK